MFGIPVAAETWDWEIREFDGSRLRLVADNDLTYHHALEVVFTDLDYLACPSQFTNPVFREPTRAERDLVRQYCGEFPPVIVAFDVDPNFGWAERLPCLIAADSIEVVPGLVHRSPRADLGPGERVEPLELRRPEV